MTSHFADVVDAWVEELMSTVEGLDDVTDHRYASWSTEALTPDSKRHLAIWPAGEPDNAGPFLAASPPADLVTQSYVIVVWEDASNDSVRRMDDDTANLEWLDLHEAIRDRLYVLANQSLGWDQSSNLRYQGVSFDIVGTLRVMVITFTTNALLPYS